LLADAARFARHSPGDRWYVDETYIKGNGVRRYVYRAVDQHGRVIDVLVSARRFFARALRTPTGEATRDETAACFTGQACLDLPTS